MKARNVTILLSFGLLISSIGCVVLAYLWIDRSVTLAYVNQSIETNNNTMKRLEILLENEWVGMSEDKVLKKLKHVSEQYPAYKIIINKDDGVIWFDEVRFKFESGQLKSIQP